jgi:hypothetical protein
VEVLVQHASKQCNNKNLPASSCHTATVPPQQSSQQLVALNGFLINRHALYLLGNEMAWKGLVDVTKKSQKPQHNNLPCY